jgi:O-antigen/teichoic acid export membrane protein
MSSIVQRRVFLGLGANAYNQAVTIAVQVITVPLLLSAWGAQLYGEWLILFAIPAFLRMTDLGFSISAGNDMTAQVARDDRAGALVVFQSLSALVLAVVGIGLAVVLAITWHIPLTSWLNLRVMDVAAARWVVTLLAADILIRLFDGVTHAGFRACGDYARHVALSATVRLLQFVALWIVALNGGGPTAGAAAFLTVSVFTTPALAIYLCRRHAWITVGISLARLAELRRLLRPALASMTIPVAQALNLQGMVIVVGTVLGAPAVVVFSTLRTLTRLVFQVVLIVSRAAEPELAGAFGGGNKKLARSLFLHALRAGLWLGLAAVICLATLGPLIVSIWTQGKVTFEPLLYGALLASAFASVLWQTPLFVLRAANAHVRAAPVYMAASALAVAAAWAILQATQALSAAGITLLLMDLLLAGYTMIAAAKLLEANSIRLLGTALNMTPLAAMLRRQLRPNPAE